MLNFEACAADQFGTNLHDIDIDSFLHFVADNVDHNSDTIDVLNTFHGIGIIACVTNAKKCSLPAVKRITIQSSEISEAAKNETKVFNFSFDMKSLKIFKYTLANFKVNGNM